MLTSRIVTSKQMKQIERNSIQYQMSYLHLMENAGCAAAQFIHETLRELKGLVCMVFCGKGNNGGDGFVVARKLHEMGAQVSVVLVEQEPKTEDALHMYHLICSMGITIFHFDEQSEEVAEILEDVDVVVDALFGSGFHGELDQSHHDAVVLMNSAISAVFSLDVPSGINCDTGEHSEEAVMADFTIIFDSCKPAHLLEKYLPYMGKLHLVQIGIDALSYMDLKQEFFCPCDQDVFPKIPIKPVNAHKSSTGKLLNIAGGMGCTGAAVLSSTAALRSGAGYVITAVPKEIYAVLAPSLINSPFRFIDGPDDVTAALEGCSAVSFGCGIGVGEKQQAILDVLLHKATCPVLIDADGINNLAENITILTDASCEIVLTPHFGEAARLCKTTVEEVAKAPLRCARKLAKQLGVVMVLKGANTIIACPEGKTYINQTGNQGLAKAGSGDVLTGIITSLISQGMLPFEAAVSGVYLQGLAADRCLERLSIFYMQPEDILLDLGEILKRVAPAGSSLRGV